MARVQVLEETTIDPHDPGWTLWFQWCRYLYDGDDVPENGYRFIWKRPQSDTGARSLQAARGQARIPSIAMLEQLVAKARAEGWGHYDANKQRSDLEAAANRLRAAGMIVDLERGFVGWPKQEAIRPLTPEQIADERFIRGDDALPLSVATAAREDQ